MNLNFAHRVSSRFQPVAALMTDEAVTVSEAAKAALWGFFVKHASTNPEVRE